VGSTKRFENSFPSRHRLIDIALLKMGRVDSCTRRVAKVLGTMQVPARQKSAKVRGTS